MPQFAPNEEGVAIATFPTKPAGLPCTAELWLASDTTPVATSDAIPFTATGEDQSLALPIAMPSVEGTYPVYLGVFSNGQYIKGFRADEDVVIAPVAPIAGSIYPGYIFSKSLEYWRHVTTGMEIPLNEEISLAPLWINESEINIVGHVDLEVTYPDGTKASLSAVLNQDEEAAPNDGYSVQFEPFTASQEGTYTIKVTLSSAGQVLDSVTFTLEAPEVLTDPNVSQIYINYWTQGAEPSDFLVGSEQTATLAIRTLISTSYTLEVALVLNGEVKASASFAGYFQDANAFYQGIGIDIVMPDEAGEYDVLIRTYRAGVLTGTYPQEKLTVYPIVEPSSLAYQNLVYQLLQFDPIVIWRHLDVQCDIVNIGDKTITREVTLWHHYHYPGGLPWYTRYWRAIKEAGFVGGTNDGKVTLILAPGQSFHYWYGGTSVMRGAPNCIELRDNMGGKSDLLCLSY